jgi:hypothetical protein
MIEFLLGEESVGKGKVQERIASEANVGRTNRRNTALAPIISAEALLSSGGAGCARGADYGFSDVRFVICPGAGG